MNLTTGICREAYGAYLRPTLGAPVSSCAQSFN